MNIQLRDSCRALIAPILAVLCFTDLTIAQTSAPAGAVRAWTDQLGRVTKASFVSATATAVVLRLENGAQTTVPLAMLSKADQSFVQQQRAQAANALPGTPAGRPLTWPSAVTVDPKVLNIVIGKQDAAQRQYQYLSGSFEFMSYAPLNASVMKDAAIDFELGRALFDQLPWGWQPKPQKDAHFRVFLTETLNDFYALGGVEKTSGGSKDDYIYEKLSAMGLEKVGQRYAFDPRKKKEGDVLGLTYRLLAGDMRPLTLPWSELGMEELVRHVAYHHGALRFTGLEPYLKVQIEERAKQDVTPEADRFIKYLRMPRSEERRDVQLLRHEYYFDGLMLVYFFGFLDGDGKGTRWHQYYAMIARESLAARIPSGSSGGTAPSADASARALELIETLVAGRTDVQLRADMLAKFRSIGVKLN